MSTTIDQKVVSMQFDNRQFERNVQTSMGTISKLKDSLNFSGATKGLEGLSAAANKCDMSGLGNGVEAIRVKFSALQVMAVTALTNITNSAINAGKRITSALTIEPIKMGFSEYETQLNAVQTILANTQSKGSTLEDVNGALDELNTYADKTIYNFTEMTRNIGTFTAAGVDLDKSVTSIKGIANLAAVSGSSSQQASTAMYQLSQALAAGKVSLMDWNSVVNAGMGGQVFQDALKRTAEHMGTNVDALIKKYGSFRESLTQGEWLTADVLTETLTQLSGAYTEADLIAQGYSKEQAKQIVELADTAVNAATKVKTFTQLIDTTKEALQSGWTQSWEIIIGDFEEAKELWTNVSDFLNEVIEKSAESRNNMLQGWKDAGGRDMAIDAIKNAFQGLLNIVKPISEAFREVFPPMTSEKLLEITERVKELTAKFREASENAGPKLKSTFKGIFSVIKMGVDVVTTIVSGIFGFVGAISGLGGGVLTATGALGDWLSKLSEAGKITEVLGNIFGKINEAIALFVRNVQVKLTAPGFEGFLGLMDRLWTVLQSIGGKVVEVGSSIAESLVDVFRSGDLNAGVDLLNGGIFASILLGIKKFIGDMSDAFDDATGIFGNVGEILDSVKDSMEAYQQSLQAETLKKIATAIAILAAAIVVIAMIDPNKLAASLGAITVLFADLMASMAVFNTIGGAYPKAVKAVAVMTAISTSVLILATALKVISTLSLTEMATGLVGVLGLTAIVIGAAKAMASGGKIIAKGAGQMVIMAAALKIMASVCKDLSTLKWEELAKGLAGMAGMMVGLVASMKLMSGTKFGAGSGAGIVLLATSLKIMASAVQDFSGMKWEEIGKGLVGMAGALAAITVAVKFMPKNMISTGAGLVVISSALVILSKALDSMGNMSGDAIAKGLTVLGTSMVILALGLNAMTGTLAGSAAMLVATAAMAALTPVLRVLGGMTWTEIAKGMVALAGAFAVMGVAGLVLGPITPVILSLAGAMTLLGIGCVGIGAGLTLVATGFTALAAAGAAGATAIVASLTTIILGIAGLIPALIQRFGDALVVFCQVIAAAAPAIGEAVKALVLTLVDVLVQCIPTIADGAMKLIAGLLASLAEYTPQIVESLFQFIIGLINALAAYLPDFIQSAVNLISQFFTGIVQALASLDFSTVVSTIAGIGLFAALFMALSALSSLIPGAMVGVLGMGVLVAELGLVLAAIGLLAQIPGLQWLINEGGQFLQAVGTAIGQFVGGIVGGFAQGVSSSFPQIGADLSAFMTNLQPFIAGAKGIDSTMTEGVKAIAETILILTAADILNGLTSWLTGGSSLADFGAQLVPFGKAMASYAQHVAGLDSAAVAASIVAAKHLVKLADIIPNSGGLASIFAGDNDMGDFANKIVSFGKGLTKYSNAVSTVNISAVNSSISSAKAIVKFIKSLEGFSGSTVSTFKSALDTLGKASVDKFVNAFTSSTSKLSTAGSDMMNAVLKGLRSKQSEVVKTGSDTVSKLVQGVSGKKAIFQKAGTEMITGFAAGFTSGTTKVITAVSTMVSTMATKIRSYYYSFNNAGYYLVAGFCNGITQNTFMARARAKAMAEAALAAARAALAVASPSRKAYEIGAFFGEGFVNAIGDATGSVYKASTEMAGSAKEGLNDALSKVRGLINGDLDVVPTITPVLDLSEIQNGASQISGLFANQSVALAGANAGYGNTNNMASVIEAIQSKSNDNSEVVSAIAELRSDFGALVEAINGMHIRMDSGAVVGQLIGKIDNSLGQIATHKGRGN